MMKLKRISSLFLSALMLTSMLASTVQAALLDMGPVVPEAVSTENPINTGNGLGHGFPLWYRDTNRVPLQLCTDRATGMCLTAEPNTAAPLSFPNNMGDELFWWVGDATIAYPQQGVLTGAGQALLVQGVEAAFSTGNVVSGAQVSFARIRIRIDTPYVGTYLVTTPYKQFTFTVDAGTIGNGRRSINFTEDIGIAAAGDFSGALSGSIGPFLYCTNAPIVNASGSFLGDPNVPCTALGSKFNPPSLPGPANYFRVQGPNGFDVQTNQFAISGKLYTDPISTPLAVDKLTYARNASGVQVSAFATAQAMSNQVNGALAFPQNFALTNAPSSLQLTGTGLPSPVLTTNNPADGKFFTSTGVFALQNIPANATITNTADTPVTVKTASLVDEVKITSASFNPINSTLTVSAESLDTLGNRTLSVYVPGNVTPLGTIAGGQFSAAAPFVAGALTYAIPPVSITVKSDIGGEATAPVIAFASAASSPLAISTDTTIPSYTMGSVADFYNKIDATGGVAPYSWSVIGGAIPPGIAFFPSTGELYGASGNITTPGTYSFILQVTDSASTTSIKAFTLAITPATLAVSTASPLPVYTIGGATDFYAKIATTGGAAPYIWTVSAGSLPPGIALFPATGELYGATGNIVTPGTYNFTLQVSDRLATIASKSFTLVVAPAAVVITTASPLPAYTMGGVDYYNKITTAGGTAPFSWTITAGAMPPGIAFFPATGELYGAAGNITTPGTYNFTLRVTDGTAATASKVFSLVITPPPLVITSASSLPAYTTGGATDYYNKIATTGGAAPYTWAITAGAMPPGIAFFPATGELYGASGNITTPGTYNFTLRVTDGTATSVSKAFSLVIQ